MDTAHRKIELQAPADLSYLVSNATRAARAKIDLHFPPSAAPQDGDDDTMKKRVEELVDQYITTTFNNAKPNLSINGLEGADLDASLASLASAGADGEPNQHIDHEPYDTRLASRIQATTAQIEALNLHLANMRRQAPIEAAEAYIKRQQESAAAASKSIMKDEDGDEGETQRQQMATGAEDALQRWEEMQKTWATGTETLGNVKAGIGATTARVERARRAVDYLDAGAGAGASSSSSS